MITQIRALTVPARGTTYTFNVLNQPTESSAGTTYTYDGADLYLYMGRLIWASGSQNQNLNRTR